MPIDPHASLAELFRNPQKVRDALELLSKLEKMKVQVRDSVGTITVSPLLVSGQNAIIDLTFAESSAPPAPDPDPDALDPETITWRDSATVAGGTFGTNSIAIANTLIKTIKTKAYNSKIKYLLPLLGSNLATARMPLRDALGRGIATNFNLVDADFSEATGLQGNGTTKYLSTLYKASELGSDSNGGMGYWERSASVTAAAWSIGSYLPGFAIYGLEILSTTEKFYWGDGDTDTNTGAASGNHHYYGQRETSSSRRLFRNGTLIATDAASPVGTVPGIATNNIMVLGIHSTELTSGRCGLAYLTSGTLTDSEITDFHTVLQTYLITPTGR